jgi:Na+-driven multidrug efflux pump
MLTLVLAARFHLKLKFAILQRSTTGALKQMLKIAVPTAVEPVLYQGSQLALTGIVASLGSDALAVRAYAANISTLPVLFSVALSQSTQILVSRCYGGNDVKGAQSVLNQSLKVALVVSSLIVFTNAIFGRQLFSLFSDQAIIVTMGSQILWWNFLLEPGRTSNVIVGSSLRAVGDPQFPAFIGVVFMWCVAVPLAWFLGIRMGLGILGVWIGIAADEGCRGVLMYIRWQQKKWTSKLIGASL